MAITSTTQNVSSLTINKVPSASVYKKMKDQNLINENELYVVSGSEIDKYTFTATAGQSTFTIPFEFDGGSSLTIYYNGVMMQEDENYTISGNDIILKDWATEDGDTITVMGIEGAAAIDFAKDYDKYSAMLDSKATEAVSSITSTGDGCKSELNTIVSDGTQQVQDLVDTLPANWENTVFKDQANTFGANGRITMDPTYTPTSDNDLITKKYVSENSYKVGDTLTTARTDLGDDWLLCNGEIVDAQTYPELSSKFVNRCTTDWQVLGFQRVPEYINNMAASFNTSYQGDFFNASLSQYGNQLSIFFYLQTGSGNSHTYHPYIYIYNLQDLKQPIFSSTDGYYSAFVNEYYFIFKDKLYYTKNLPITASQTFNSTDSIAKGNIILNIFYLSNKYFICTLTSVHIFDANMNFIKTISLSNTEYFVYKDKIYGISQGGTSATIKSINSEGEQDSSYTLSYITQTNSTAGSTYYYIPQQFFVRNEQLYCLYQAKSHYDSYLYRITDNLSNHDDTPLVIFPQGPYKNDSSRNSFLFYDELSDIAIFSSGFYYDFKTSSLKTWINSQMYLIHSDRRIYTSQITANNDIHVLLTSETITNQITIYYDGKRLPTSDSSTYTYIKAK